MNSTIKKYVTAGIAVTVMAIAALLWLPGHYLPIPPTETAPEIVPEKPELDPVTTKAARSAYFFRLLRDPATDAIPPNIRSRELNYAETLPDRGQNPLLFKRRGATSAQDFTWTAEGPFDIGGRTRALDIDPRNPSVIIAGAVSGGIWKSTDGGTTWQLKSDPNQNYSVSSLARDPRRPDTLYYSSGEFSGNSASDRGFEAIYFGTGIYRSTDNGETWNLLPDASDQNTSFNSEFDFISRIVVSPTTGTVLFSSNGFGVYRSPDGENFSDTPVLGTEREQRFAEVAVASNGDFLAVISESTFGQNSTQNNNPGVYRSTDDGITWTEVTPSTFPSTHSRSVADFAPSNPEIAYVLTHVSTNDDNSQIEDVRLHKLDFNAGTSTDRSDNIPNFGGNVGRFWTQSGYDMLVHVKPDNENFVIIGGTNLFRSTDGFATPPADTDGDGLSDDSEKDEFWIGGYAKANDISSYPGQHPDQHIITFYPGNSDRMWVGHDGGLSETTDVTASSVSWNDKNRGYITTQFYTSALPGDPNDTRIMGGTQDNGTPFFKTDEQQSSNPVSQDISFGDGSYAYFTNSHIFVSRQNGSIVRYNTDSSGNPSGFSFVHPSNAGNQLFIHPYVVDPNDETVMYYPGGTEMWRNTELDQIQNNQNSGGSNDPGWSSFQALPAASSGYEISTLEISLNPSDILYYAASAEDQVPMIFRLDNARNSEQFTDISIPDLPSGAYVHDIALDPANANEAVVIASNYNISGIYFTRDGGETWEAIEGNLTGNTGSPGPSIRSATIIPGESGDLYVVGTSTGVYSTSSLDGTNTQWVQEAPNQIGFAVSEFVSSRVSNGDVAVGTHGRGMHLGSFQGTVVIPTISLSSPQGRVGETLTISGSNVDFGNSVEGVSVTFGTVEAIVNEVNPTSITVEIPRRIKTPEQSNQSQQVGISIELPNGNTIGGANFTYLPPESFELLQNYPNPFNPTTNIPFDLTSTSFVVIQIYNSAGKLISEPVAEQFQPGAWVRRVDLSNMASGVYFYRVLVFTLDGNQFTSNPTIIESRKMTLIK